MTRFSVGFALGCFAAGYAIALLLQSKEDRFPEDVAFDGTVEGLISDIWHTAYGGIPDGTSTWHL